MGLTWAIMIAMCMLPAKYWLQICLKSIYKQLSAMHKLPKSFTSRYYSYAAVIYFLSKLLLKIDVAPLSSARLITVLGSYNPHFHFRFNRREKSSVKKSAGLHYYHGDDKGCKKKMQKVNKEKHVWQLNSGRLTCSVCSVTYRGSGRG